MLSNTDKDMRALLWLSPELWWWWRCCCLTEHVIVSFSDDGGSGNCHCISSLICSPGVAMLELTLTVTEPATVNPIHSFSDDGDNGYCHWICSFLMSSSEVVMMTSPSLALVARLTMNLSRSACFSSVWGSSPMITGLSRPLKRRTVSTVTPSAAWLLLSLPEVLNPATVQLTWLHDQDHTTVGTCGLMIIINR